MNDDFALNEKSKDKQRDQVLDESFKKAEISRNLQSTYKRATSNPIWEKDLGKGTTSKTGSILIIIAILAIVCIYFMPWAFIAYNADYIEGDGYGAYALIFNNAKSNDIESQDIVDLFGTPNYIGVTISDFTDTPIKTVGGFISLAILGLLFWFFQMIDRFRKFSAATFSIIHCFFAGSSALIGVYIILSVSKFIGVYFLIAHNMNLEQFPSLKTIIIFLNPIIIIILGVVIVKSSYTVIKIYYTELERKSIGRNARHSFFKTGGLRGKL